MVPNACSHGKDWFAVDCAMTDQPKRAAGSSREALLGAGPPVASAYNLLRATVRTFEGNTGDVYDAIDRLVDDLVRNLAFRDEEATTRLNRQVGRTFFNWLCAVTALVEHTRNGVIPVFEAAGAPFVAEYHARRAAFNEPSLLMVRELRNYATHSSLPVIFSSLRKSTSRPPTATVFLGVESLRNWNRWTAPARAYVMSLGEDIEVRVLVESYAAAVDGLYSWFGPTARTWAQQELDTTGQRLRTRQWG
jgi:hypothetical protein